MSSTCSRWRPIHHVHPPAIRQHVATGIRLALGVAWLVIVPAECSAWTPDSDTPSSTPATPRYLELVGIVLVIGTLGTLIAIGIRRLTILQQTTQREQQSSAQEKAPA